MKKFYYKKDVSLDKTPIVLRLERRHTLEVDKNGKEQNQSYVTARTKSVSSVQLLKDFPSSAISKTREITKSLSEDVLSKGHLQKSAKVITETDLSSSWLYKAKKASTNTKDSPQKTSQPTGLSPVALTDPKLKPVPVPSSARTKKSHSCLCYFAIMMAIGVCTIGVLATITGILYNEIVSSKNLTSTDILEPIDISDMTPGFRSLNDNYSNEFNFTNEGIQPSLGGTENTSITSENLTLSEDQTKENIQIMGVENFMNVTDLSQLLNSQNAGIKFKDGNTIIYELNSSRFSEYAKSAKNLEKEELDSNENKIEEIKEPSTSRDVNILSDKVTEEKIKELENLEIFINSQLKVKDIFTSNEQENLLQETLNIDELKENIVISSSNFTLENENLLGVLQEHNESELFKSEESHSLVPETDVGVDYDDEDQFIVSKQSDNNEEKLKSNDMNNFKRENPESDQPDQIPDLDKLQPEVEKFQPFSAIKNTDKKVLTGKSEHDVNTMLMVLDEPEEESPDTVLKRNGEISLPFENFSLIEVNIVDNPVSQLKTQLSREQEMSVQLAQQMKPLDMKMSLVEAIKHLQVLDVNNTLLTSRMKSIKSKPQNTEQKLTENLRNKQNITAENIKYLQNLRLVLQKNLLRI